MDVSAPRDPLNLPRIIGAILVSLTMNLICFALRVGKMSFEASILFVWGASGA